MPSPRNVSAGALRELEILKEIDETGGRLTQRHLSVRLGVALGLVNAFLRRLVRKGYVKARTLPARRIKYLLTPHGIAQKTRLTYEYIRYSFKFIADARERGRAIFSEVRGKGGRRVVFYGVSEVAELAYLSLKESSLALAAVADPLAKGRRFLDKVVVGPEDLGSVKFDALVVTAPRLPQLAADLKRRVPVYHMV